MSFRIVWRIWKIKISFEVSIYGFRVGSSSRTANPPGFILKKRGDLRPLQSPQ